MGVVTSATDPKRPFSQACEISGKREGFVPKIETPRNESRDLPGKIALGCRKLLRPPGASLE